jgi:O-acetyl-ADP-ribose deacetylase (regulator of RNase III)
MTQIEAVRGDITSQTVDAIVNAANSSLLGGGGVDGAIHRAGGPAILAACRQLRSTSLPDGLPTGDAVATTAGRLAAGWVIHTVGPVHSRRDDRTALLESAYSRSLEVAASVGARSIAFPAISAGVYGWPMDDAARVAVRATRRSVAAHDGAFDLVRFVLFNDEALHLFQGALAEAAG